MLNFYFYIHILMEPKKKINRRITPLNIIAKQNEEPVSMIDTGLMLTNPVKKFSKDSKSISQKSKSRSKGSSRLEEVIQETNMSFREDVIDEEKKSYNFNEGSINICPPPTD